MCGLSSFSLRRDYKLFLTRCRLSLSPDTRGRARERERDAGGQFSSREKLSTRGGIRRGDRKRFDAFEKTCAHLMNLLPLKYGGDHDAWIKARNAKEGKESSLEVPCSFRMPISIHAEGTANSLRAFFGLRRIFRSNISSAALLRANSGPL